MKIRFFRYLTAIACLLVALFAQNASAQVRVYEHCNYGGYEVTLTPGDYNLSNLTSRGAKNDDISAIRVAPGYVATIYEHDRLQGRSRAFADDNSCLVNVNLNDVASSIRVTRSPADLGRVPPVAPAQRNPRIAPSSSTVILYEDCGFAGDQTALSDSDYDLDSLTRRGMRNDSVSAIVVKPGYVATAYEHSGFTGRSRSFTGRTSCLVNLGFNDLISSIRVTQQQSLITPPSPSMPSILSRQGEASENELLKQELAEQKAENERLRARIRVLLNRPN